MDYPKRKDVLWMKLKPLIIYIKVLNSRHTCYVAFPEKYNQTNKKYPVTYLLHSNFGIETD